MAGNLIIGRRNGSEESQTPHPSLIGGKDPVVKMAGMVDIRNGKIHDWDDRNGHFKPSMTSIKYANKAFEKLPKNYSRKNQRKEIREVESLVGKYGSTLWEPPIDEEDAKWYSGGKGVQGHQGLVGKVVKNDGDIITMFCQGRTMRFRKKDFKVYQAPEFEWGEKVVILDKNLKGNVCHFTWHLKSGEYFYFVEVDGKRLKKRYFAEDLKKYELC